MRNWRYYHGLYYTGETGVTEIKRLGEQGEIAGVHANHHRNLAQHLLTMVTQHRPAFQAKAVNSERRSLEQARLATLVLEYYMHMKRAENYLRAATEYALVLGNGWLYAPWDPLAGKGLEAEGVDEEGGLIYPHGESEGDLRFSNPTLLDVAWDPFARTRQETSWVAVRSYRNRWDLAARYPEHEEQLIAHQDTETRYSHLSSQIRGLYGYEMERDTVSVWEFYHDRTDAMPDGRYVEQVGSVVLNDNELQYDEIPLYWITPGETMFSAWGYSPLYDHQGIQEALNSELSTIVSNHKSGALNRFWVRPGSNITAHDLNEAFSLIESDTKPEALTLTQTAPEVYKAFEMLVDQGQLITGVNDISRGQIGSKELSGTAMALLDSKALQLSSNLQKNYYQLLEDFATGVIRTLKRYARTPRLFSIVGEHNRSSMLETFTGEDFGDIDRVVVESSNPFAKTTAGRIELAERLMQGQYQDGRPWISQPEEYLTVLQTGNLEPMLEGPTKDLMYVREENEVLLQGGQVEVLDTDNHDLHIREHSAILSDIEIRRDASKYRNVYAHVLTHVQKISDPNIAQLQFLLGRKVPLPPMPQPAAPNREQVEQDIGEVTQQPGVLPVDVQPPRRPRMPGQ